MHIDTKCVQSGYRPKNGEPRVLPIIQSTTYKYDTAEAMGDLFDLKSDGFFYSRLANPTVDCVEKKIADLEGGVLAVMTSSGQAASLFSILNICKAGDHVISSAAIYGGTFNLFNKTMRDMGIDFTFVSPDITVEELDRVFRPETRCVFGETISNPSLDVLDISLFAADAHRHGVPLIVDNTFATPVNCRPFEFGADVVTHSTTKYMDGHACALGGVVVDSGKFDWKASGKFPMLTTPDETYHGIVYTDAFGAAAYGVKLRTHIMRDIGAMQSPQNAFLLNLGLETLFLRVERHCENAVKVAKYLESRIPDGRITWVDYPGLPSYRHPERVSRYLPNGSCGVVSFGVAGGREGAVKFMEALKLAAIVTHVADARTCVLHPASTTHRQLSDKELEECGVSPDLIRFSVGIENIEDILDDISSALDIL